MHAGAIECQVQCPGASKPQNRRKASEKPTSTVMAVMSPWRKPAGMPGAGASRGLAGVSCAIEGFGRAMAAMDAGRASAGRARPRV
jgi:hypothetical protein